MIGKRRLAEQGAQVAGKDLDGMVVRPFAFFPADIAFDGGQQKPFGRILNGKRKLVCKGGEDILLEFRLNGIQPVTLGHIDMHAQDAFLFTARDGQDLVRLETVDAAFEFIIGLVHAFSSTAS